MRPIQRETVGILRPIFEFYGEKNEKLIIISDFLLGLRFTERSSKFRDPCDFVTAARGRMGPHLCDDPY